MEQYTDQQLLAELTRRYDANKPSYKRTFIKPRSEVVMCSGLAIMYIDNDLLEALG